MDRNDLIQFRFDAPLLRLEIKRHLGTQPITIRQAKVAAKAKVGVGRHTTPPQDNLPNSLSRNPSLLSKAILRNTHRDKKFLFEKLTRSHRRQQIGRSLITCDNRRFRHSKPSPVSTQNRPDSAHYNAIIVSPYVNNVKRFYRLTSLLYRTYVCVFLEQASFDT